MSRFASVASCEVAIRVALRCRPFLPKEKGSTSCIEFIVNEPRLAIGKHKDFTYDFVFDSKSSQENVYKKTVHPLVLNIFKGYNATVLAYGQTGSGKTYTMGTSKAVGTLENEDALGVIPRAVRDIFTEIGRHNDYQFIVGVSILEIYNDEIVDLLADNRNKTRDLLIREASGDFHVAGLTQIPVNSLEEVQACLNKGFMTRTTASTLINEKSSRSHVLFTIHVERRHTQTGERTKSMFHFVDLAGSERQRTDSTAATFKEGVNINIALLELGNVISALSEEPPVHVPYRNSKLTKLLKDSLGGNSITAIIACISPAESNLTETLNTLLFANKCRKVKNAPKVNNLQRPAEAEKIIATLKERIREMESSAAKKLSEGVHVGVNTSQDEPCKSDIQTNTSFNENCNASTAQNESTNTERAKRSAEKNKLLQEKDRLLAQKDTQINDLESEKKLLERRLTEALRSQQDRPKRSRQIRSKAKDDEAPEMETKGTPETLSSDTEHFAAVKRKRLLRAIESHSSTSDCELKSLPKKKPSAEVHPQSSPVVTGKDGPQQEEQPKEEAKENYVEDSSDREFYAMWGAMVERKKKARANMKRKALPSKEELQQNRSSPVMTQNIFINLCPEMTADARQNGSSPVMTQNVFMNLRPEMTVDPRQNRCSPMTTPMIDLLRKLH